MKYDVRTGLFSLKMISKPKINCLMEYELYPFDAQMCRFALRSATKNSTFQVESKAVKKLINLDIMN